MFDIGQFVVAVQDLYPLGESTIPTGAKLKIIGSAFFNDECTYDVETENGAKCFFVSESFLMPEKENGQREILQPLLGLTDEEYRHMFIEPAAMQNKTELTLLREYVRAAM